MSSVDFVKGQSFVHESLNRDKMYKEGWWLQYCICDGVIIGDVGNPFFGGESKDLCEHSSCQCVEVGNPFCSNFATCLCITDQCNFPKLDGSPTCVCCSKNKALAGSIGDGWKPVLFDFTGQFDQQFWIYYFLCMGTACNSPGADGRPMLAQMEKCLCIKQGMRCVAPIEEGVMCAELSTTLCCWKQCQFPPDLSNNPKFACCGFKLNKQAGGGEPTNKPGPMAYGKPSQSEMS